MLGDLSQHRENDCCVGKSLTAMALAVGLTLLGIAGCGHSRSAMRPVYLPPATVEAPVVVPERGCPPGQDCGPTRVIAPGFEDQGVLSPQPAPGSGGRASSTSPESGPMSEPSLDPDALSPVERSTPEPEHAPASSRPAQETEIIGPGSDSSSPALAPLKDSRRAPSSPRRLNELAMGVKPYVDDPSDFFEPPRADRPWRYIVFHHSAHATGSYAQIDRDHRSRLGTAGCGYHFVIGNGSESPDGQIEVARRWSDQRSGAHVRDGDDATLNEYGIGICLIGDIDGQPPTQRQVEAARALVAYLQSRYSIDSERVGTHAQLAHSSAACPGRHFPAQAILGSDSGLAAR